MAYNAHLRGRGQVVRQRLPKPSFRGFESRRPLHELPDPAFRRGRSFFGTRILFRERKTAAWREPGGRPSDSLMRG